MKRLFVIAAILSATLSETAALSNTNAMVPTTLSSNTSQLSSSIPSNISFQNLNTTIPGDITPAYGVGAEPAIGWAQPMDTTAKKSSKDAKAEDTPVPDWIEYYDEIQPSVVSARKRKKIKHYGREWRQQYRLIYNFNKLYPYALVGRKMMRQVDSTIAAGGLDGRNRNVYIKNVEKELLRLFEKDIRQMTITQGFLLTRLVDRECGMTVYDIVKDYEGGVAASFWSLVGKMFDQDLKSHYDPEGKDAKTEKLIEIWESGDWDNFYYGVFGEEPKRTIIVTDHLSTQPKTKSKKN